MARARTPGSTSMGLGQDPLTLALLNSLGSDYKRMRRRGATEGVGGGRA